MEIQIRRVRPGDETALAYIQTESWNAAFQGPLEAATLKRCTSIDCATAMYRALLEERKGNGYILALDGEPHCIAWWDAARDREPAGSAELICIHSLPANWGKGHGGRMMDRVLADMAEAGYSRAVLWVFAGNERARRFYESRGFRASGRTKTESGLGALELCYARQLGDFEGEGVTIERKS